MKDLYGLDVSGANGAALDRLDTALDRYRCFGADALACADAAIAAAPEMPLGHALRAWMILSSAEGQAVPAARASLHKALALPHDEREAMHLKALSHWCAGQWHAAARVLEDLSLRWPLDSLALKAGHTLDYYLGQSRMLHDRIARALPAWSPQLPGWHAVLSMMAFGLEENGFYAQAERLGREAIALRPDDAWAQHAVVHVLEMQGRHDEGVAWMLGHKGWQDNSRLAVHNWWHLALHHLARGDGAAALALYDSRIRNPESRVQFELVDASALLWRLSLRGIDVGDRWHALASAWAPFSALGWSAFNDLHAAMAFASAGRSDLLEELANAHAMAMARGDDGAATLRDAGHLATLGLVAHAQGEHARAAELLRQARPLAARCGGSHAQRDILDITLIESARRSGQSSLASALQAERDAAHAARRHA